MAQFRVEFVLDPASGKYRAEMYHPDRDNELLLRTAPIYETQEAGVLGVVQLFKGAIPRPPAKAKKTKKPSRVKKAKGKRTRKRRR